MSRIQLDLRIAMGFVMIFGVFMALLIPEGILYRAPYAVGIMGYLTGNLIERRIHFKHPWNIAVSIGALGALILVAQGVVFSLPKTDLVYGILVAIIIATGFAALLLGGPEGAVSSNQKN
ncbi:hypothetical protein HY405_01625 [Candidatus Microgenomates bacterium]|nr:hypothetical protein [Candidatus Microgenomates bacterium]